ncbi:hypothetical protein ACNKHW_03060 [Shigella flexneri]
MVSFSANGERSGAYCRQDFTGLLFREPLMLNRIVSIARDRDRVGVH